MKELKMPTISKIRLTNVIYENGAKRYNDETFHFDGQNGIFLLENGGGKTVFLQTVLQAVIPHVDLAERKIKDTLSLDGSPAHIAIEWIIHERPRRYALTVVSLYLENNILKSFKYTYDYDINDQHNIDNLPFVKKMSKGKFRPTEKGEISEYYSSMKQKYANAEVFTVRKEYHNHITDTYKIIPSEWYKIASINSAEGAIDEFFSHCKSTDQLLSNLLIPTVEDALQGTEKNDFVDTFEKQREHFKQNRKLLEDIEQFKVIKEKVDDYVDDYSLLNNSSLSYQGIKVKGKSLVGHVNHELTKLKFEENTILNEIENYTQELNHYLHQEKSLEIKKINDQLIKKYIDRKNVKNLRTQTNETLTNVDQEIQNIEIANIELKIETYQGRIESLNNDLKRLDISDEEQNYLKFKNDYESEINGQYSLIFENYEKQIKQTETLVKENMVLKSSLLRTKEDLEDDKQELNSNIAVHKSRIDAVATEVNKIESQVLAPINENNIESYNTEYIANRKSMESDLQKKSNRIKDIKHALVLSEKNIEITNREYLEASKISVEVDQNMKTLLTEHNNLVSTLEGAEINLTIYDTIYSKENSVVNSLIEKREKSKSIYEDRLLDERISKRLSDQYKDAPFFVADSVLLDRYHRLSQEVDYLEYGVQYLKSNINHSGIGFKDAFDLYPYWTSTVVTSEYSKKKVIELINKFQMDITHPIYVITTSEAVSYLQGRGSHLDHDIVFPHTWQNNLDDITFKQWQLEIIKQADKATDARVSAHVKLSKISNDYNLTLDFFRKYPYNLYEALREKEKECYETLRDIKNKQEKQNHEHQNFKDESAKLDDRIKTLTEELDDCLRSLELFKEYISLAKEKTKYIAGLDTDSNELELLIVQIDRITAELNRKITEIKDLEIKNSKIQSSLDHKMNEKLYIRVKDTTPVITENKLDFLDLELQKIDDLLKGIQDSSQNIKNQIDIQKEQLAEEQKNHERKIKTAKFPIEHPVIFNIDDIYPLSEKSKSLTKELNEYNKEYDSVNHYITVKESERNTKKQGIEDEFGEVYIFNAELSQIENDLKVTLRRLNDQNVELNRQQGKNTKLLNQFSEAENKLNVLSAEHTFKSVQLVDQENEFVSFEYEMKSVLSDIEDELTKCKKDFEDKKDYIQKKKDTFVQFCRSNILDSRLLETALKGIERKKDYIELTEYQKNISKILDHNIRMAEDDRRESDKELQNYLSHLMTYTKNVLTEIDAIQRKTRLKVDNKYKQIFIFNIPNRDEYEAKEALRRYIDRIIIDYDSEEENSIDHETLRQFIEKKLSVKNLILNYLGDNKITIKCRKVTNDLKITHTPMTWESSNKWSGGEKWSKNMTLFLSILNYLAEKKQFLSVNQKRNRTVILDNPFGKASSKHVLDPVFFIAENLGFQMIAVTAHAEGNFVTDYFPIVYSGKLRLTTDSEKQVMSLDQTLNTAHLKMNDPDSLLRFEDVEQLDMFSALTDS